MPVAQYGVWVGKPISFTADGPSDRTPHINLVFSDDPNGGNSERKAAINVKSSGPESELVYWFVHDFSHPITDALKALPLGFQSISPDDSNSASLGIDYVRTTPHLLEINQGRMLAFSGPDPNDDILDQLEPILQSAIDSGEATIYLFGSSFGTGIHEIHMNQGSLPRFDNGVFQDGGFLLYFPNENRWEAVFLAFASQKIPTDDQTGLALPGSQELSQIVPSQ